MRAHRRLFGLGFALVLVLVAASAPATPSRHVISQKNRRFAPTQIKIQPGDVVVFQNDDLTDHHIMVRKGPSEFSSRLLQRGASFEVTLEQEGTWTIGCRIHPRMRMKIRARAREGQSDEGPGP